MRIPIRIRNTAQKVNSIFYNPSPPMSEGAFTPCQGLVLKSGLGTRSASFPHQHFPPLPHLPPPLPHVSSVGRASSSALARYFSLCAYWQPGVSEWPGSASVPLLYLSLSLRQDMSTSVQSWIIWLLFKGYFLFNKAVKSCTVKFRVTSFGSFFMKLVFCYRGHFVKKYIWIIL